MKRHVCFLFKFFLFFPPPPIISLFLLSSFPFPLSLHYRSFPHNPLVLLRFLSFLVSFSLLSFPTFFPCLSPHFAHVAKHERKGKGKRGGHAVSMCSCIFTVHAHVYTSSLQRMCVAACVFRLISPSSFYLYFHLPKTAVHFFSPPAHVLSSSQAEFTK